MEVTAAERTTTYTGAQSLAAKINSYIVAQRTSIAAIAKEIGYSRVTVSRYLNGKYDSDPTGIEEKLAVFLAGQTGEAVDLSQPQESRQRGGQKPRFYESRDAKAVLGVCQSCQEYLGLGIVVARSGYGKTYALREYAKLPRVAYIECDDTMSSRDLVEAIERSIGLPNGYGTIWRRVNGIREFFNTNRGYLLIIDEADKLVSKYTQKKMEILRAIFDQSDVGLVIAGEPKLEAQIKTYLARMANRVDFYASLRGLAPSEVEGYLEDFNITPDALLELKERACNMRTGCFRLLDRTLSNVGRILAERGEGTVTVKIIEQASTTRTRRRGTAMRKIRICLDAGHTGNSYNQSPVVKSYYESRMVWALHLKLKARLEERGFEVVTTRPSIDTSMDVYARGEAAKGCDVFLSLHSNACGVEGVDYPVVYRAYDNCNDAEALALALARMIGQLMGTRQAGRTATRRNSAGGEYYGVMRGARAVGVPLYLLLEHSFHTNTAAAKWLLSESNLDRLAEAEAELLGSYFKIAAAPEEEKTAIMGAAQATAQQMALYCRSKNTAPQLTGCSVEALALLFLEEGAAEGVRGDVAWAQSLHETGFFKFGGIVQPGQNNYAGIGALNGNSEGQAATFPDPRTGVRAQIQHLKAYASNEPLMNACVDPRFFLVERGTAPWAEWLGAADNPSGKGWAVPGKGYGTSVVRLLKEVLTQQTPQAPAADPQQPDPPAYPSWQKESLETLVTAGVIGSPEQWEPRMRESITVGEVIGILGKLYQKATE